MRICSLANGPDEDRRSRILSAAERAFAQFGFRGASMQHVAAEARMSAGNLYRYFGSKEDIVSGLAERDQSALARDFEELTSTGDVLAALGIMLRKHLVDAPVEHHRLVLEIWAEAARNETVARLCGNIDREIRARLAAIVRAIEATGLGPTGVDPDFAVRLMMTVVAGLFKRRATDPSFDGEAEVALALGVFHAVLSGVLKPYQALEDAEVL